MAEEARFYHSELDVYRTSRENTDGEALYNEAHDAASADGREGPSAGMRVGQEFSLPVNKKMWIRRGPAVWFDTSSLPADATLISAEVRLTFMKNTSIYYTENFDWYLKIRGGSDLNALSPNVLANYPELLSKGTQFDSKYADDIADSMTAYTFSVPIGYINKTGNTVIVALNGKDEAGTPPDYSGGQTLEELLFDGGTDVNTRPLLTVTYSVPSPPPVVEPNVVTDPATSVKEPSATLNGALADDGGEACDCFFLWGETEAYEHGATPPQSKTSGQSFSQAINGLEPSTTYHFKALAENSAGFGHGADRTFTTKGACSTVSDGIMAVEMFSSWEDAHDAAICDAGIACSIHHDWPYHFVTASGEEGTDINLSRCWLFFNLGLDPDEIIDSAVLSLYGRDDVHYGEDNPGYATLHVVEGVQHDPLQGNDWGAHLSKIVSGGSIAFSAWVNGAYNDIPLNDIGKGWINKGGTTKLCLRLAADINDTPPSEGATNGVAFYASEAGASTCPKLTVVTKQAPPLVISRAHALSREEL